MLIQGVYCAINTDEDEGAISWTCQAAFLCDFDESRLMLEDDIKLYHLKQIEIGVTTLKIELWLQIIFVHIDGDNTELRISIYDVANLRSDFFYFFYEWLIIAVPCFVWYSDNIL